jgi:hypothetical protein
MKDSETVRTVALGVHERLQRLRAFRMSECTGGSQRIGVERQRVMIGHQSGGNERQLARIAGSGLAMAPAPQVEYGLKRIGAHLARPLVEALEQRLQRGEVGPRLRVMRVEGLAQERRLRAGRENRPLHQLLPRGLQKMTQVSDKDLSQRHDLDHRQGAVESARGPSCMI